MTGDSNSSGLGRVLELAMASALCDLTPFVFVEAA
jgi:hypothetical protein